MGSLQWIRTWDPMESPNPRPAWNFLHGIPAGEAPAASRADDRRIASVGSGVSSSGGPPTEGVYCGGGPVRATVVLRRRENGGVKMKPSTRPR